MHTCLLYTSHSLAPAAKLYLRTAFLWSGRCLYLSLIHIYTQIKALLDLATSYGFDENLWHNYLTFLLLMNENSFSLVSEKSTVQDGSCLLYTSILFPDAVVR